MKRIFLFILLASTSQAAFILSDFDALVDLPYVTAFDGPWSSDTDTFTATTATIANFGTGIPSGQSGNGFIYWLGGPQDWTTNTYVLLTGLTLPENATPTLNFYVEDVAGNVSIDTHFTLANFVGASTTIALPIQFGSVDRTQVAYWGFQVNEVGAPAFGYTFDKAEVSAVPEPSTLLVGGLGLLALLARYKKSLLV